MLTTGTLSRNPPRPDRGAAKGWAMGILGRAKSAIDLYMHMDREERGPAEVLIPGAGMSSLAACVADRVWGEGGHRDEDIPTRICILGQGPSGSGKEQAIKVVLKLVA